MEAPRRQTRVHSDGLERARTASRRARFARSLAPRRRPSLFRRGPEPTTTMTTTTKPRRRVRETPTTSLASCGSWRLPVFAVGAGTYASADATPTSSRHASSRSIARACGRRNARRRASQSSCLGNDERAAVAAGRSASHRFQLARREESLPNEVAREPELAPRNDARHDIGWSVSSIATRGVTAKGDRARARARAGSRRRRRRRRAPSPRERARAESVAHHTPPVHHTAGPQHTDGPRYRDGATRWVGV